MTNQILINQETDNRGKEVYMIHFHYDPEVISLLKNIPGHWYYPDTHNWSIPKDKLGFLKNQFKPTVYWDLLNIQSNEDLGVDETLDQFLSIPNIDVSEVQTYLKAITKLYAHQQDFLKWSINRELTGNTHGFLLADEMGLGKSLETISLALYNKHKLGYKHCLIIVCMNSAKYNWKDDIEKFTNETAYLLGSRRSKKDFNKVKIESGEAKYKDLVMMSAYGNSALNEQDSKLPYFLIMNIEAIRYADNNKHSMTDVICRRIQDGSIGMIVVDEIHRNASMSSQNGKFLLQIKKKTKDKAMWIPMSGTPITSKPLDLFLPLRLVDGIQENSFWNWKQEYCVFGGFGGYQIVEYKNLSYLKTLLDPQMIRRKKEDVLDLPEKIHITEYVENTQFQQKLYSSVLATLQTYIVEIKQSPNPLAKMLKLRQVNEDPELLMNTDGKPYCNYRDKGYLSKNARLQKFLEIIQDILDNGEKIIVFSNWVKPLEMLSYYIQTKLKVKSVLYTGEMSQEDRNYSKEQFIQDPDTKLFLGTVGAAGVSHTLTVATHVIFYDDPWNPAVKSQAEDRAYRISQKNTVTVHTLVTKDTVDEIVENILVKKQGMSNFIVDGELDAKSNPELIDMLLS